MNLITEVERKTLHKKMKLVTYVHTNLSAEISKLKKNGGEGGVDNRQDYIEYQQITKGIHDLSKYYRHKLNVLDGRLKVSGDSGKSKNLTQIDNNVYHYHIGDYKDSKKGDKVSNEMIEFQVLEVPELNPSTGNTSMRLVIIFYSKSTHGYKQWNMDDITDISDIGDVKDFDNIETMRHVDLLAKKPKQDDLLNNRTHSK